MNKTPVYRITNINKWALDIGLVEGDLVEDLEPDCQLAPFVKLLKRKGTRSHNQYCIDRCIMERTGGINYITGDRVSV